MNSSSSLNFDEHRWVIQIRRTLDEELEEDYTEIPVSIFNVPKTLMASNPDSYIPQEVALGPYHHWRPELYEMERYKLAAAKSIQKQLHCLKFQHIVDQLTKLEPRIRACYHMYLDIDDETLGWMMAIDASFLLQLFQIYAVKEDHKTLTRVCSRMSHLFDIAGRKSAHNAILRDMVMLENQIPLFLLRKMFEFHFSTLELSDGILHSMLMGLCKELSPFKMMEELPNVQVSERAHLLDFLYHTIVPNSEDQPRQVTEAEDQLMRVKEGEEKPLVKKSIYVEQFLGEIWKLLSKLYEGPVRVLISKPVEVISNLPWNVIFKLPGLRVLKQPIEFLFISQDKEPQNESLPKYSNSNIHKPPLLEEITIPSVSKLSKAGVRFLPTHGSISTISFDPKTVTLYLPTVSLDVNTEVILRNLVAYEACSASGPLVFTRYTELMNGIIDDEEDAKLLRERGIVLNHLKSDGEVANLWNGMSKSIRLTKVPSFDKVIEDVNKYYNGRWKVRAGKFMKRYVFGSWQCLTFLATILLLLLTALQAFCSVHSCARNVTNIID
ncbi:putative UPF0481 protein At3g02645 [Cornus florida]|uniref:putative UPF0481 protein At3g02645 n=1 Tax=Cornus florida TaxID=4283 RepID=UPI00289B9113|nr:putative UPF0481 protein At3g02645 [Cornus florida]